VTIAMQAEMTDAAKAERLRQLEDIKSNRALTMKEQGEYDVLAGAEVRFDEETQPEAPKSEKPKRTRTKGKTQTKAPEPTQGVLRTLFRDLTEGTCHEVTTQEGQENCQKQVLQDPARYQLFVGRPLVASVTWE